MNQAIEPDWLISSPSEGESNGYQGAMDIAEILRAMIEHEARSGRLTSWRRHRIIQFAAQLGISPIEAGRLVQAWRDEVLQAESQSDALFPSLRLVGPGSGSNRRTSGFFAILAGAGLILAFFALI